MKKLITKILDVTEQDPEAARRGRLLNALLAVFGSAILLAWIFVLAADGGLPGGGLDVQGLLPAIGAGTVIVPVLYVLNRRGSVRLAGWLFILLLILAAAMIDGPEQVIRGRGWILFSLPIFLSSQLLRSWTSFPVAALSSLALAGVAFQTGRPLPDWLPVIEFFFVAAISWLSAQGLERAAGRASLTEKEYRRWSKEALRDSEEKYRLIVDNANDWIYLTAPDQTVLYSSPSCERVTGYAPQEFYEDSELLAKIVPLEDRKSGESHSMEAQGESGAHSQEFRILTKSGETRWISHSCVPVRTAEGEYAGRQGINRDITKRRRAEENLIASETRYRRLFEAARDGILILDAETGMIMDVNPFMIELLGFSTEEFRGKEVWELGFLKDIVASKANFLELQQKAYVHYENLPLETADGRRIEVEFVSYVYPVGGRKVIQCNIRDITERRLAEKNSQQLAAIVESSDDAIISKTVEGIIISWNKGAEKIYGYPEGEVIGRPIAILVPPGHEDEIPQIIEKLKRGEHVPPYETERRQKSGQLISVSLAISLLKDAKGEIMGASIIARDITERKQAEEALRNTLSDLERSNADLEQFAYVASHDLQESLRMVSSFTQLLAQRYQGRLDKDADEFIGYAVDGSKHMQRLINDLLSYSRVGTKGKPPEPVPADAALDRALDNLKLAIEESRAVIVRGPLPSVAADDVQLSQLFQNLVANGVKFRGEDPPRIRIACESRGNEWVFSVRDNGIGIDPQYLDRIFIIFQRLHERGKYPGTGIGLAICKKIVQRHGGRIWAESEPGKGSMFFFTMPMLGEK
ncbi:MAG: PAS domain S-box protein [Anaerolineales bacterium]